MTKAMTKTLDEEGTQKVQFVERPETFSVMPGGRSGTPVVTLQPVTAGDTIRVTCVFNAKTASGAGFYYGIQAIDDTVKLSSGSGPLTSTEWTTATRIDFFRATGNGDASFEASFESGDLNGQGLATAFMLTAENLGS